MEQQLIYKKVKAILKHLDGLYFCEAETVLAETRVLLDESHVVVTALAQDLLEFKTKKLAVSNNLKNLG